MTDRYDELDEAPATLSRGPAPDQPVREMTAVERDQALAKRNGHDDEEPLDRIEWRDGKPDFGKMKIPPERVDCSEYTTKSRGMPYRPHEGESVWVAPWAMTLGNNLNASMYQSALEAGDLDRIDRGADGIVKGLADAILTWDLTDDFGEPYKRPNGTQERIRQLPAKLIMWLTGQIAGSESVGEGKRG